MADNQEMGIFVGLWVPSIHSLGTLILVPVVNRSRGCEPMSELTLFIIGAVVFAITVYGTVMAAGVA